MEQIIELIKQACAYIKKLIVTVIEGCLNFARNVVGWFKSLNLQQGRDVPFIANANQQVFKEMLQNEITHNEYIEADALDQRTQQVLGKEELVVLA